MSPILPPSYLPSLPRSPFRCMSQPYTITTISTLPGTPPFFLPRGPSSSPHPAPACPYPPPIRRRVGVTPRSPFNPRTTSCPGTPFTPHVIFLNWELVNYPHAFQSK